MVSLVPDFDEPDVGEEPGVEETPEVEETPGVVELQEVEEVPEIEETPEIVEEPTVIEESEPEEISVVKAEKPREPGEKVAMSRTYELDGVRIEIAYINYNKVRITKGSEASIIKEFTSTKEAVDYYVEQMQELEIDE